MLQPTDPEMLSNKEGSKRTYETPWEGETIDFAGELKTGEIRPRRGGSTGLRWKPRPIETLSIL